MDTEKKGAKRGIFKKFDAADIFIWLVILLGIILVINILLTSSLNKELKKSAEALKEKLKPAKIELILVKNSKCSDCFDISAIASNIKNANVNITKETISEFDSKEGREIIKKYKIGKIPSIIVTGEIDKISVEGMEIRENVLVLARPGLPYTDAATGEIGGRVVLYNLKDPACKKCNDLALLISQIKSAGIRIYEEKNIAVDSNEGKELARKYKIDFVPTIILSKDADAYEAIQQAWPQVGSRESDGYYVLRLANPPFINLTTGRLRGIVNITYLTDKSCSECYDVSQHKEILTNQQSFAISIDKEETSDISDSKGKELIAKYNITSVPTVILSHEVSIYPSSQALRQLFSIEKDGSYVFRMLQIFGVYKDLANNAIVKGEQQNKE